MCSHVCICSSNEDVCSVTSPGRAVSTSLTPVCYVNTAGSQLNKSQAVIIYFKELQKTVIFVMDPDPPQEAGEPEVTVETVPDNIETGAGASTGLGLLDRLWYSLLAYFSNPWALLILLFLLYKLYRHLRPILTEPVAER